QQIVFGEIEESVVLQQGILEPVALGSFVLHVRTDSTAAVNGTAAIGELDLLAAVALFLLAVVVVVVERNACVLALNQAAAGRVVLGGSECQAGIFRKRIHRLYQALAKGGFTYNQPAIVVLDGAGDNFRGGSRAAIDQHHQRIFFAAIAVR